MGLEENTPFSTTSKLKYIHQVQGEEFPFQRPVPHKLNPEEKDIDLQ